MSSTLITFRDAVEEALRHEMSRDPAVVAVVGETDADDDAAEGFAQLFGDRLVRLDGTPETVLGTAAGAAAAGLRAVCAISLAELGPRALARLATAGSLRCEGVDVPLAVRVRVDGAHAPRPGLESLLALPGVAVVAPSNAADAKGLVVGAIRSDGPVCVLEEQSLTTVPGDVPEGSHEVGIGESRVLTPGGRLSLLAHGAAVRIAELAAAAIDGDVEVVDLRTLRPLDATTVIESAKRNGRVLLLQDAGRDRSTAAELAAILWENAFEYLDAPLRRVEVGPLDEAALAANGSKSAALMAVEEACAELLAY